ncbi:MAG: sensor histidine kinase [Fluviicola sp.]
MLSILKNIIKAPEFVSDNSDQVIRYKLSHAITLFSLVSFSFHILSQIFNFNLLLISMFLGFWFIMLAALIYIRKTKNHFLPILIISVLAVILLNYVIYANLPFHIAIILAWAFILILICYFTLGFKVGIIFAITLALSFSFYFFYWIYEFPNLGDIKGNAVNNTVYVFSAFAIIGFLGYQYELNTKSTKEVLKKALSEMQEQYNVISKQSEEKTVMLKEIHHRVKNNLQIITSLLRLQARELESPEAIAKFKDATHRVIAMSMIHEKMYQHDALSSMHLREYLHDLSLDLISSYQSDYQVKLNIECDVETIGLKSVVPLALILNELISNTLKYAFDENDNCSISISFKYLSGKNCKLIYKDSGTWKPPSRKGSFGLDLIESLTYQLEGSLKMVTSPETSFEFIIAPLIDEDPLKFESAKI